LARGWLAVSEGEVTVARVWLERAATIARHTGDVMSEAAALHDLGRLGGGAAVAERLLALSRSTGAELVDLMARNVQALAANNVAALEAVAADFERTGATLFAAEALARGAASLKRGGEPRRAAGFEFRAGELAAQCEGAVSSPALLAVDCQALLTARQMEIATLAASGMASRAIADTLYLSVRTVDTQLQRIYVKLGIDRRSKLADALRPLQAVGVAR
jgi:DNA-binding NarL/FixJ family response regulator